MAKETDFVNRTDKFIFAKFSTRTAKPFQCEFECMIMVPLGLTMNNDVVGKIHSPWNAG
ncbi:hypothetical protein DPMN_062199 [Dreissena polymorpha]|uniref:Uncharacterized protein n=1 Tax=Dreissena polymorpha TaxID=45954 RepID=A0A9D4C8E1_DREPO|nr:hypothetical protein DPMN_062137 [Dreissena polymorpha]KAH3719367.1 hypothetical protein DPMN_062199 [Dreissena polymorpha]